MNPIVNPVAGVDKTFLYITGIAIFFLVFITGLMIYFVFRYRATKHPEPHDIRGNTKLELAWMVIPTCIALSMFYFGWESYLGLRNVPPGALEIDVVGQMYSWNFTYPDGKKSEDILVVPQGKPIKLNITSNDVIHGFSLPAFRIKIDAVKGMQTYVWFMADKAGQYQILCTEYCGIGHSEMLADLKIVSPQAYQDWLSQKPKYAESTPDKFVKGDEAPPPYDPTKLHQLKAKVNFSWKIDGDLLHVRLRAATTGWVGIGFNPIQRMKGANFILGMVDQDKVIVTDDFGTSATKHKQDTSLDGEIDLMNVYGLEEDGITEIGFTMRLDSGDSKDTILAPEGDTIVLLAHGAGLDSLQERHSYKGKFKVNLSTGVYQKINR
jgi:cytochrome c oxidase subunit 2